MTTVDTYRGQIDSASLGPTLIHEHIFVRNPELETNLPDPEWVPDEAVRIAIEGLTQLHELGIRTVVDLTVPGLGRDARLVSSVAEHVAVNIVAATGWYTPNALPTYFRFHGPGRAIGATDPLVAMFVDDIRHGLAGTRIRAAMIKVVTDEEGFTPDVTRILAAAAEAHQETGVTITTHSHPASRNGLEQQHFLVERGVDPERIVIGHSGDSEDIDYLQALLDGGSVLGMDRFGMEHVMSDERRTATTLALIELGYEEQLVLSHDAAFYSHVTPPSWRREHAPRWRMDTISSKILPKLRGAGVAQHQIDQMLIDNPRRLLESAT